VVESGPSLPLRFRVLNTVGKHLGAVHLPFAALDEEALVEAAMKATGLNEFGNGYHREGLLRLLESVENDAALHLSGQLAFRDTIVGGAVEAVLQTVPGSLLIQTHSNPVETSASLASLFYSLNSRTTERLDVRRMTEAILGFHEHQIARNLQARDAHPGALFDVYYDRLVADPIGTVRDIYDHYGLAWSEEFEERLNHYLRQNPRGKHGAHLYAPENFGQTRDTISRRFAAYIERFELASPNGTHQNSRQR
jgi:hypothetical protein